MFSPGAFAVHGTSRDVHARGNFPERTLKSRRRFVTARCNQRLREYSGRSSYIAAHERAQPAAATPGARGRLHPV
jgi:hypothetical protein